MNAVLGNRQQPCVQSVYVYVGGGTRGLFPLMEMHPQVEIVPGTPRPAIELLGRIVGGRALDAKTIHGS